MVVRYAEALDAMTKSCDLYKEAAEAARAALADFTGGEGAPRPPVTGEAGADRSPMDTLARTFGRFRLPKK